MQLSALDQSPIFDGDSPADALAATLECAAACDRFGLTRYWVAEHHGSRSFAGCAPEILMPTLMERTQRIRIGSGGIMLNHYSPYKVAECFRTLDTLFPGRVDLGVGRAPGSDPVQAGALAYGSRTTGADFYPTKLSDLLAWMRDEKPTTEAFRRVAVTPGSGAEVPVWQLASSTSGAMFAAHFGLPLALAHFIEPDCLRVGPEYRDAWAQRLAKEGAGSAEGVEAAADSPPGAAVAAEGRVILAIFAICADSEAEARHLAAPAALWRQRIGSGRFGRFARTEKAQEALGESANAVAQRGLIGTAEQIVEQLQPLLAASTADELMVVTICEPLSARIRSYELLLPAIAAL